MSYAIQLWFENWEANRAPQTLIHLMPQTFQGELFGIHVRFSPTRYKAGTPTFERLVSSLRRRSNGVIRPATGSIEFHTGILSLYINCATHAFNEQRVQSTLNFMVEEFFPSIMF